jgi:hypothetical protein
MFTVYWVMVEHQSVRGNTMFCYMLLFQFEMLTLLKTMKLKVELALCILEAKCILQQNDHEYKSTYLQNGLDPGRR